MLKRSLIAVVAVAVLATVAQAGYIKTHDWPTTYVPQELMTIPVYVDVGYYVKVVDQNKEIKLSQKTGTARDFTGSVKIKIRTNFNLTLSCSITKTGSVNGNFSCTLEPENLNAGTETEVTVVANVTDLEVEEVLAGTKTQVANVKINVVPR
jgi:hypothetical protein